MAATRFNLPVSSKCSWHCCSVSFEGDDRVHINKKYQVEQFKDMELTQSQSVSIFRIHEYIEKVSADNKIPAKELISKVEKDSGFQLGDFFDGKRILKFGDITKINKAMEMIIGKGL